MFVEFFALLGFAISGSVTPGPNNMMLLSSGVNYGFRKTVPHILGIIFGFEIIVLCSGLGLGALITAEPRIQMILKYGGGAYMLYLSWKIASSRTLGNDKKKSTDKPLSFLQAALFQWVNPKGWVMAVSAIALFIKPETPTKSLILALIAFFIASIISANLWASFGVFVRKWLSDPTRLKWFNITMGIALAATILIMLK